MTDKSYRKKMTERIENLYQNKALKHKSEIENKEIGKCHYCKQRKKGDYYNTTFMLNQDEIFVCDECDKEK